MQETALTLPGARVEVDRAPGLNVKNPFFNRHKKLLGVILALIFATAFWQIPSSAVLDGRGVGFVATLAAGVMLWAFESLDDYVVALLMFLSWISFGIVSPETALSGFSTKSWFFVVAALGVATAVSKSGLFFRLALRLLCWIPRSCHKTYSILLLVSGIFATPLVPTAKARVTLMTPMVQAITRACAFKSRSSGSARLALAGYLGFSQMSFMFLTGAAENFAGWSLLPEAAKAEFGWGAWALAALPLAVTSTLLMVFALFFIFPPSAKNGTDHLSLAAAEEKLPELGSLKKNEWLSIVVLTIALAGWMTKPVHGVNEVWVATGAFLFALVTGALDKETLKKGVDWSFVLFFGVICSMGVIVAELRVDRWLGALTQPLLSSFASSPLAFLIATVLIVCVVRFFLRKLSTVVFIMLTLSPWASQVGIHPGVLLITVIVACECWFFHYQDGAYQIVYYSTHGESFSHAQAQKVMCARFLAVLFALVVSVPYWKMLGFIQ